MKSIENVHKLDMDSVDSQKARQCIDKLMGYERHHFYGVISKLRKQDYLLEEFRTHCFKF